MREEAFEKIQKQANGHYTDAQKKELLAMLNTENKFAEAFNEKYKGEKGLGEVYGEDYGNYWSALLGAVASFADFNDSRVLEILVFSAYNPDSDFGKRLVAEKEKVLPAIEKLVKCHDPFSQANAAGLLKLLAEEKSLSCPGRQKVEDLLVSLANDPDENVRASSVEGLVALRSPRAVAALQNLTKTESKPVQNEEGQVWHPLSDQAKGQLQAIAQTGGPKAAPCYASSAQSK